MKNKSLVSLSYAVACITWLACSNCTSGSSEPKKEPVSTAPSHVETFVIQKGKMVSTLQIPAELIAYRQVDLYAKVNSFVKDLKADIGSEVSPGQLLVTLEAPELSAQQAGAESKLKSMEAIYTSSNATYNRLLNTSKTPGTVSGNDLEIALAKKNSDLSQLEAAKAAYRETGTMLSYLTIKAPFAGVISARNVNLGAYVGPAGKGSELPVFTLQQLDHLRLVIAVPEAYKGFINKTDEVKFRVKAYPQQVFTAKIARRSEVLDRQLRSERIELDVYNTDKKLSPGMVAEAKLSLSGRDSSFVVPRSAVVNSTEGVFMIKVADKKTQRMEVTKSRETDSLVEVFGNFHPGDVFVKRGTEELRNGTVIR